MRTRSEDLHPVLSAGKNDVIKLIGWEKCREIFQPITERTILWKTWALSIQPKSFSKIKISKKGDNLARYTQIFEIFSSEVLFPFNFASGISRIFGWMVGVSEI